MSGAGRVGGYRLGYSSSGSSVAAAAFRVDNVFPPCVMCVRTFLPCFFFFRNFVVLIVLRRIFGDGIFFGAVLRTRCLLLQGFTWLIYLSVFHTLALPGTCSVYWLRLGRRLN